LEFSRAGGTFLTIQRNQKRPTNQCVTAEISAIQARGEVFKTVMEYILNFSPYFGGFVFDHTAAVFDKVHLLVDFHA
jgi:hypothetical protein